MVDDRKEAEKALVNLEELEGDPLPAVEQAESRRLTAAEFHRLREVPALVEWLANLTNPSTRRAYEADVTAFLRFVGIRTPDELRHVTRAHVIAWRKQLEQRHGKPATLRRKLSALAELFDFLTDRHAVLHNPVQGVKRPAEGANEGKTPALSDAQARRLLEAPPPDTLKGKRDRAILAVLLFHALRRGELCRLTVADYAPRRGVPTLTVHGKGSRLRYLPVHPYAAELVEEYLTAAGHREDLAGALFRPVQNPGGTLDRPLTGHAVYRNILKHHARAAGIPPRLLRPHVLRATAATNALEHGADIARVRDWLGHRAVSTTQLYDKRRSRPEDSPTFKVKY
jgi:site-specific recombinase XerD